MVFLLYSLLALIITVFVIISVIEIKRVFLFVFHNKKRKYIDRCIQNPKYIRRYIHILSNEDIIDIALEQPNIIKYIDYPNYTIIEACLRKDINLITYLEDSLKSNNNIVMYMNKKFDNNPGCIRDKLLALNMMRSRDNLNLDSRKILNRMRLETLPLDNDKYE